MAGQLSSTRGIGMTSQRTRDRMIARLREKGIDDEAVLAAMREVPRHLFVEEAIASRAYEDTALPIGFEQTISQPYVVARMISALRVGEKLGRVLEVGTGCGYQAAVLAALSREVYSIERIAALLEKARTNLRPMRIANLRLAYGDGAKGLPEAAPFDAIILAAAAPGIPQALIAQLAPGGRLVAPVGKNEQELVLLENRPEGLVETRLDAVRFVPLLGGKR
ncbi:MAG: protein-L-isoaspartate(D-aspartate) O-methyltransferase [Burkholderiales bacterium]